MNATQAEATPYAAGNAERGKAMSDIRIVREYPHPPLKVWKALTDPALVALWGMKPEGLVAKVGARFKLVAKPQPGWRGYVDCEVLEVREPELFRYSWVGDDNGAATYVTYRLAPEGKGTRLVFEHTGFKGLGGFVLAKLMMGPGWKKMLAQRVSNVLDAMDDAGALKPGHGLRPKFD